ncbi:hypothetical protein [Autumnicola musiva]|uniref:asparagine synthase (glutamine-hydrolyzing) n=1 Tax=Autumnicola musiva TaxID=3075589 RepID=A0ABU3D7E4_9FLAO|nr:hypothetical protein [Zunongwangia sp. F117]MDT0677460.1 hypothetical protein [Zunongwangia sp. F117]
MSKILFVCLKDRTVNQDTIQKVKHICESLNPDNIQARPTKISYNKRTITGISNPVHSIEVKDNSFLFGQAFGERGKWYEVNGLVPDGNFSIFRSNQQKLEIVTDILGTRSVWYYKDKDVFLASTSQRAIIQYLGDFTFNKKVIPWVLSTGMLGPGLSWDSRISLLNGSSSLTVDMKSWDLNISSSQVEFIENKQSDKEHVKELKEVIDSTFSKIDIDYSEWNLTLSGGYDSRGNICLLPKKDQNGEHLKTVTWGLEASRKQNGTDAQVAEKIANIYDLPHRYFHTDPPSEPLEIILDRFCLNGEGRIDHIGGYTDGFNLWKKLFEKNITGVIRGDEVFGSYNFISDLHLKKFVGLSLCSDYSNLKDDPFIKSLSQEFPQELKQQKSESLENWRDRLYQSHLVPTFLSALSDLKQPYVEQINPLLARGIVRKIREMPAHLRTDKKAFKTIVDSVNPNVKFASRSSTMATKHFLKQEEIVEIIRGELSSHSSTSIFPRNFINDVLSKIRVQHNSKDWYGSGITRIKALIPKKFKRGVKGKEKFHVMDYNLLAFRMFIISRMNRILEEGK